MLSAISAANCLCLRQKNASVGLFCADTGLVASHRGALFRHSPPAADGQKAIFQPKCGVLHRKKLFLGGRPQKHWLSGQVEICPNDDFCRAVPADLWQIRISGDATRSQNRKPDKRQRLPYHRWHASLLVRNRKCPDTGKCVSRLTLFAETL